MHDILATFNSERGIVMNVFVAITNVIYKNVERVAILLLVFTMTLLLIQTLLRFGLNIALPWAEELCRYTCIWMSFLGGGIGIRKGIHVGFDLIKSHLPQRAKKWAIILADLIILFVATQIILGGWKLSVQALNQTSSSLGISMAWVYSSLIVGGILIVLYSIEGLLIKRGEA